MLNRIAIRLGASLTVFVMLMIAAFAASWVFIQRQTEDAVLLRLAAAEETLAMEIAKDLAIYGTGQGSVAKSEIQAKLTTFGAGLDVLANGGSSELVPKSIKHPARNGVVRDHIGNAQGAWTAFDSAANVVLASPGASASLGPALEQSDTLVTHLSNITTQLENDAAADVRTVMTLQGLAVAAAVLLYLIMLYATWSGIGVPLKQLVTSAENMSTGDVGTPIAAGGLTEIRELAESFERLRLSIKAMLDTATSNLSGSDLAGLDELDNL